MITEEKAAVVTLKVNPSFDPSEDKFPHYRLVPLEANRQGYYCLIFFVNYGNFIMLEPRIKRYLAMKKLSCWLETADYVVYELLPKG